MKKISKDQSKRKEEHVTKLLSLQKKLEGSIAVFNEAKAKAYEGVDKAFEEYNNELADAESLREEVFGEQEEFYEEKSENWQQSERGEGFSSWKEQWSESLEAIELEAPEDLEAPEMDHADKLDELPEELET